MVIAGVAVSALLGFVCWFMASVYRNNSTLIAVSHPTRRHLFAGSILGGVLVGIVAGPIATTYFAYQIRPIVAPLFLIPFATIASAIVVFALVNYSLEKMSVKQIINSAKGTLLGLVCGAVVAFVLFFPLYIVGIVEGIIDWMATTQSTYGGHIKTTLAFLGGGLIYGFFVGIVLGSVFAFARYFTTGELAEDQDNVQEVTIWPLPKRIEMSDKR